ncbi:hypothetical protein [Hyalangium rubrum]|uniref:Lipoprotein n=1 Tax=Hyalangium rubrum TaxID=3103134 RepID=A0ABU5GVS0_9BACT|nr:hypothetical protein [Hyalangium sp. s54d21]MDY7225287.1 hypothetical protein [Hyalangium sp. s54d21]
MHQRKMLVAAAWVSLAGIACAGREDPGTEDPNGCTGVCNQNDGGTNNPDGGRQCPVADSQGRGPIGQLRADGDQGQRVQLSGLVVTTVDSFFRGNQGDYIAYLWVVDPCFPKEGMYVDKYFTDPVTNYLPAVGDQVTIDGLFRRYNSTGTDADDTTRHAYRPVLKSDFRLGIPGVTGKLNITKTGTVTVPADLTVPAGFGNATGGSTQANPEYGGARVHIPGPITITHANPEALKQRPADPADTTYLGFEVSGGVLVNNYKTFGETRDGGSTRCDWHARVQDGGTVFFPNGIRGVWDTYSHVPCGDGGFNAPDGGTFSSCSFAARDAGYVPGSNQQYTYVLYPQNCETDLPGVFDAGTP